MSPPDEPFADLPFKPSFKYPGADITLRSRDFHHFPVPKSYILNSSPALYKLIQTAQHPPNGANGGASLPVVDLPESGAIIHSLLTFVFPVTPLVPSTPKQIMELLSVAQKYQMISTLVHIRASIAQQNPPANQRDAALHIYALAQKYGLRHEALQAARTILKYPISIEDLEDKLDIMPGASLYELWKYYQKVRVFLASDLTEFRTTGAQGTLTGLQCVDFSSSRIPRWLDDYIASVGEAPHHFDLIEFNTAQARHLGDKPKDNRCACRSIPSQTIRNFWGALASVVDASFQKGESALSLVQKQVDARLGVKSTKSLSEPLDVPDANLILRSFDFVNFRVHKQVLAMVWPLFKDLLSLPQPADSEFIESLPVIRLSEDAELLNSLVSLLYPIHPVIPNSYEKVLYLLAACEKYEMAQVQSFIRSEVDRGAFPAPVGIEVFGACAIARAKGLVPEMEKAARLSLDYPMTFETLEEGLRLFKGSALRDLARLRKRCRDTLVMCLDSFLDAQGPSSIWVGCPEVMPNNSSSLMNLFRKKILPNWLRQVLLRNSNLKQNVFSHRLTTSSNILEEYIRAIRSHASCSFCSEVHIKKGSTFCMELKSKLSLALDKEQRSFFDGKVPEDPPP